MKYAREEVRRAPIQPKSQKFKIVRRFGTMEYAPGSFTFWVDKNGNLCSLVYPYPAKKKIGEDNNLMPSGGQGIGTVFARRVYEELLQSHEPGTTVCRTYPISESFKRLLEKAGLNWRRNYSLQEHVDAFRRRKKSKTNDTNRRLKKTIVKDLNKETFLLNFFS